MLEMICNIISQKKTLFSKDNSLFNMIHQPDLSISVFNQLNKYLTRKEIEFDNVFTEEKKDDNKSVVCANFIINNLLNILNKKDVNFNPDNINDDKIQKKKINTDKNDSLNTIYFLKSTENTKKKKIKAISKTLTAEILSSEFEKNKKYFHQVNELNNMSIINNLHLKKINDQFLQKKINVSNINKNNIKLIENQKKIIFPLDIIKNKNVLSVSKNINNIVNIINRRHSLKMFNKEKYMTSYTEPLILNNTKNSIEWKKLINQKILLSISNKHNQAEIYLKPESLGSMHIIINMKDNAATLKFISKYNAVRIFFDRYMPFLRNSLKKNGIKLEDFKVCNTLNNKKSKIYKNLFYKNIHHLDNLKDTFNTYEKNLNLKKYKVIDLYV